MQKLESLEMGNCYHIFNRGVNRENIFKNQDNYPYFLSKYYMYINPIAETFAFCLLKNHFHFLVRIRTEICIDGDFDIFKEWDRNRKIKYIHTQFSHLFNSYAQAVNRQNLRTGSLFQHRFKRVLVKNEHQFDYLIWYVHGNPQKHGMIKDFKEYPHSSYKLLINNSETWLNRSELFKRFGSKEYFIQFHLEHQKLLAELNKMEEDARNVN
jgi:REP element-mobilizing transposase RayT